MPGRSARGRWERVVRAREQARAALGQPNQPELFDAPLPKKSTPYAPDQPPLKAGRDESIGVLTIRDAANHLGVSDMEIEAMIAAGKIEVLPTGYTRMIPTREVKRLTKRRS